MLIGENIFFRYPYKSNTDQIDDEIFIDLICQGFFGTEIMEELGIGEKMLYLKLKELKYRGLMHAREELGVMDIFKNRLKLHPSRNRQANGVLNLQISEKAKMVKNAIESKMETTDIAQKYGFVNRKDVHKFIKDTWNITYRQAERLFRIYPKIDKNIFLKLVSDGLTIRDIDKEILKYLIYSGLSSKEVSVYLEKANPNDKHQMSDWVEFVFGEGYFSQRTEYQKKWIILMDVFFWKPRIEELIEKGFDSMQIEKEIYNITWQKSPKAKNIHSKIKRIWNDEYNSIISMQKKYKYFFDYLRRIYMVYPRYNAQLLDKLREKKETPLKIDREMTKFIIFKGNKSKLPYSSKELVNIFSFSSKISSVNTQSSKYVRLFFHDIFGMNMFDINRQFYWKPRIIKFFKSGFANCVDFFNHPLFKRCYKREDNLHKHFTKIFKKEFEEIIKIYPNSRQKKKKFFELLVQKYS